MRKDDDCVMTRMILALSISALSGTVFATPLIMGHRGTAGHRPEHTRSSYELAADMGADFIEPDLVPTKDGKLIARHENDISETTNVATKFPDRKKTKIIDGNSVTGYFTEDFTLKEIKTLRAKERLAFRNHSFDLKDEVLTFEEVIEIVRSAAKKQKRTIGIIPELKHPTYFKSIGLDPVPAFVKLMKSNGYDKSSSAAIVQCFELGTLKELKKQIATRLLFLFDDPKSKPADFAASKDRRTYGDLLTPAGMKEIAQTAQILGPAKLMLIKPDGTSTGLIELAHANKLLVVPYTFRDEKEFIVPQAKGDAQAEYKLFFKLGVDGLFSDFVDSAIKAKAAGLAK